MAQANTIGPKRRVVRARFDTVPNPLIRGPRTEASALAEGDLTWRYQVRRLVSIVPVRQHLVADAWDNLDQMLSIHPGCKPALDQHDEQVRVLLDAAVRRGAGEVGGGKEGSQMMGVSVLQDNGTSEGVSFDPPDICPSLLLPHSTDACAGKWIRSPRRAGASRTEVPTQTMRAIVLRPLRSATGRRPNCTRACLFGAHQVPRTAFRGARFRSVTVLRENLWRSRARRSPQCLGNLWRRLPPFARKVRRASSTLILVPQSTNPYLTCPPVFSVPGSQVPAPTLVEICCPADVYNAACITRKLHNCELKGDGNALVPVRSM